jgi:hypothetical protein
VKHSLYFSGLVAEILEREAMVRKLPKSSIVEGALGDFFAQANEEAWDRIKTIAARGREAQEQGGEVGRKRRYGKEER